jgi:oligoribonuclease
MKQADRNKLPSKLLWIDLEMTGLNANEDVILEVAAEVTDFSFKTSASYEARISYPKELIVERMQQNIWWRDFPENRDDFLNNLDKGKPLQMVENELVTFVEKNFGDDPAILAGNSIHSDKRFIERWMPALDLKLHYRMLDVSSWKIVMMGKYGTEYEKKNTHRAFDDIQASIAELQFYLEQLSSQ